MQLFLKISRIATAAAVLLALSLLAWQCLDIFTSAPGISRQDAYDLLLSPVCTRDNVVLRLNSLSIPLSICAGITVFTILLHAAADHPQTVCPKLTPEHRLRLIRTRIEALPESAQKEERFRRRLALVFGILIAGYGIYCLFYFLDTNTFPSWNSVNPDTAIGTMLVHIVPGFLCIALLGIVLSFTWKASVQREISLLQNSPVISPVTSAKAVLKPDRIRTFLYVLAIVFIVLGVMNGGMQDVLYKAIHICTECIGLG